MSGIESEIKFIHDVLKVNSNSIEKIHQRLDKLEGDKKAVD